MNIRYLPALDGFRAAAVLAVMIGHFSVAHFEGTRVGVLVFYVLSGYLITSILATEQARTDRMDLSAFYARRVLRLFPALIAAASAYVIYGQATGDPVPVGDVTAALLYYINWREAFDSVSPLLGHFWSLSVEEQFYLVWPLLLVLALRKSLGAVAALAFTGAAISMAIKIIAPYDSISEQSVTFYPADGLLLGCGLAVAVASERREQIARLSRWLLGPALVGLVLALTLGNSSYTATTHDAELFARVWWPVSVLGASIAVATAVTGSLWRWIHRLATSKLAVGLGRISYGMYLWHVLVLAILSDLELPRPVRFPLFILLTVAVAGLSYRLIESPFLRLKMRFEKVATRPRRVALASHPNPVGADQGHPHSP